MASTKPSVLNIGLKADHPLIKSSTNPIPNPPSAQEIKDMIASTYAKMVDQGYTDYRAVQIDPDSHIKQVTELLKEKHWDALVIGGGFKMIPGLNNHLEDIINLSKDISPKTQILFTLNPTGVLDSVKRIKA